MDEIEEEFPYFKYSLEQNILSDEELVSLEDHSLILSTSYCLKKLDILKALEEIDFEIDDILSDKEIMCLIDNWLRIIGSEVSKHIHSKIKLLLLRVPKKIRFVLAEAIRFYQIAKIYLMKEKDFFIKNLSFTCQGTVNTQKTVIKILENENLTPERKFTLAAQFFVETKVQNYFRKLTELQQHYYIKNTNIDDDFACYFWVWKISRFRNNIKNFFAYHKSKTGEKMICRTDIKNSNFVIQNIFQRAVKHHNECAVYYLWCAYVSSFTERQFIMEDIICTYYEKATHTNIVIYLILESKVNEMMNIYSNKGSKIQMLFYNNKRWIDLYFEVLVTIQPYFAKHEHFILLQNIAMSFVDTESDEMDLRFLRNFFKEIPNDQRNMLVDSEDSWKVYYELLRVAFEILDKRLVRVILRNCERDKIFNFSFSLYGMKLLEMLIAKKEYRFADWFLKWYLRKYQKHEVKRIFFQLRGFEICYNYIIFGTQTLETFLNFFSNSLNVTSIEEFRAKLPYESNGKILKKTLFSLRIYSFYKPFPHTQDILEWCVGQGNVEKVKSSISLLIKEDEESQEPVIKCYKQVTELVLKSNWRFLNELMGWIGYTSSHKDKLGKKLLLDSSLFEEMMKKTNVLDFIYKFSNWLITDLSFESKNEIIMNFKTKVFKKLPIIFNSFIMKWDLDGIRKAILWCNQPVRKSRGLHKEISHMLKLHKPNTKNSQKELDELAKFFINL